MMRAFLMMVTILAGSASFVGESKPLPSVSDKEGFAGPFAGVSNGALLVAGGANFPDKRPWEGGTKVWYDSVFVLEKPNGAWKNAGKLPRPLAYGVCVTHGNGVVCVGGSDKDRYYADAFRLEWRAGKLVTTKLPSLPKPLANSCGALLGDTLYVAGGQEKADSKNTLKTAWTIDLAAAEPKWKEIEAWPGSARMLSVAAGYDGAFWLVGGVGLFVGKGDKTVRRYLKNAYRYDPGKGWKRIADVPAPVAAAPSPAPTDAQGFFYILGGDDGLAYRRRQSGARRLSHLCWA
jgi:N-acetylneuraminic acid mutarotase